MPDFQPRRPLRAHRRPAGRRSSASPTGSPAGCATRCCWAPPGRARRSRSPGSSRRRTGRRSSWPTTRRWRPSSTRSSATSSRTTRSSTSSATSTTTSPRRTCPRSDTYIEKDSSRNEEIDKLRHAATKALFERRDVIIVASVSCIYGLGAPVDYGATVLRLQASAAQYRRDAVLRHLVDLQYQRNDQALQRSRFRVRGDTLELVPVVGGPPRPRRVLRRRGGADHGARPADRRAARRARARSTSSRRRHFVTPADKLRAAIGDDRGRDGGAGRLAGGARAGRSRRRASASGPRSTWR